MRILVHPDPCTLEQELLRQLESVHPRGLPVRTLVIVPTSRLATHLQVRLSRRRDAWLGVDVLHFRALARAALEGATARAPQVASPRLLETLLKSVLARAGANGWTEFVQRRPGALRRLLAAAGTLRDAGVTPDELEACSRYRPERELAQIYRAYAQRLCERVAHGWGDDATLIGAALPHATAHARRYGAIFLHGAYELIGIHLELLRALDEGAPVKALLPIRPGSRVTMFAERFARRHLLGEDDQLEEIAAEEPERDRLAALYDEECSPAPAPNERFGFRHTHGASAEAHVAVRHALRAIQDGCPAQEIFIVARSLAPFAPGLEEALDGADLAWSSSLAGPLRRQPLVHDFLLMLRVVGESFPRRATAELLRSPRILWNRLLDGVQPFEGEQADLWSRRARIIGGLDEWSGDLQAWAARPDYREDHDDEQRNAARSAARHRSEQAALIGRALSRLADELRPDRPRSWSDHAKALEASLDRLCSAPEGGQAAQALQALRGLLAEMSRIDKLTGEERSVSWDELRGWLEDAVDGTGLPLRGQDSGGIRVLDAMQVRGLTCRRVHLVGLNSGVLPRVPQADPVLGDGLRQRLGESTGRPLPLRAEAADEERLLLALVVGAAEERVEVSWQRADATGKAKTPSLALRELARVALGRPDPELLQQAETHWPAHPQHWLESLRQNCGMLAPNEEMLLTVLRADGPGAPRLVQRFPQLEAGLLMLQATENYAPGNAAYDGGAGSAAGAPARFSVSALETLGRCPLRYFFRYVLRVQELDEEAVAQQIAAWEMGSEIHRLLERLYGELVQEGAFATGADQLVRIALERLGPAWDGSLGAMAARSAKRLPLLWERTGAEWRAALGAFIEEDLRRLVRDGMKPASLEESLDEEISLGEEVMIRLSGRTDRRLSGPRGTLIGDYKSSGNLRHRGDVTEMLKGRALQIPLYWLMTGESSGVELLGVGPGYDYEGSDACAAGRRMEFQGFSGDEVREGFLETLRVLVDLARRGRFPLRPDDRGCRYCPYERGCRRTHPPTLEREFHAPEARPYYFLQKKNKSKRPTLDAIPDYRSASEEEPR